MTYGYKSINNRCVQRTFVTYSYAYWDNIFSQDELNNIEKICTKESLVDSRILDDKSGYENSYRTSQSNFHHVTTENSWIFEKLNRVIELANHEYFNYDLNGYEYFQYAEYKAENSGHYDYHVDIALNGYNVKDTSNTGVGALETRKLSLSLLLNEPEVDFKGGEFHIKTNNKSEIVKLQKGRAVLFPSYTLHKVAPVTEGVRKSLVVWVTGPKFK